MLEGYNLTNFQAGTIFTSHTAYQNIYVWDLSNQAFSGGQHLKFSKHWVKPLKIKNYALNKSNICLYLF